MNKATCRGCGAPIVWITTRGEVVSCEIVPGGEATDAGYRPHWATCPQAGQFKRGGRARE